MACTRSVFEHRSHRPVVLHVFLFTAVKMKIPSLLLPTIFLIVLQCGTICKLIPLPSVDRIQDFSGYNGQYALNVGNVIGNRFMRSDRTYPQLIKHVTISKTEESDSRKNNLEHAWQWIRAVMSDTMTTVKNIFRKCFGI